MANQEKKLLQEIPVKTEEKPSDKMEIIQEVGSNEPTNLKTLDFKFAN